MNENDVKCFQEVDGEGLQFGNAYFKTLYKQVRDLPTEQLQIEFLCKKAHGTVVWTSVTFDPRISCQEKCKCCEAYARFDKKFKQVYLAYCNIYVKKADESSYAQFCLMYLCTMLLFQAVLKENMEMVKLLLSRGADPRMKSEYSATFLSFAMMKKKRICLSISTGIDK